MPPPRARACPTSAACSTPRTGRQTGSWTDRRRQELRTRVAALTADHLGTDTEAWAVCLQLLPTFAGTLTELCATAAAIVRPPT